MKKIYNTPEMTVKKFNGENIVTQSGVTAADAAATNIQAIASEQGKTLTGDVLKLTF